MGDVKLRGPIVSCGGATACLRRGVADTMAWRAWIPYLGRPTGFWYPMALIVFYVSLG